MCKQFCNYRLLELKALHNLALDDDGIDFEKGTITFCGTCLSSLQRHRIPELSLMNNMEVGRVPKCLQELTWAEQRLIAIYRIHIHMLHFRCSDVPGDRRTLRAGQTQPHFKGAAICVPQDTLTVQSMLPPSPTELPEIFQVQRWFGCSTNGSVGCFYGT